MTWLVMLTLYTNQKCPFAQRCGIALDYVGASYKAVEVNLYGASGFTKAHLKRVEEQAGLRPKGSIPVLAVGDELVRESADCVRRIARDYDALAPADPALADRLIALCDGPLATEGRRLVETRQRTSRAWEDILREFDVQDYLAGPTFSTVDACLVPFLFRVREANLFIPPRLRDYLDRVLAEPHVSMSSSWWWWW